MTLPAKERTYEKGVETYDTTGLTPATAVQTLQMLQKNLWLGQSHFGFDGTINEITPGTTYELVATTQSGHILKNLVGDFTLDGDLVGRSIELQNSTNPLNDGIFVITAVIDANTIQYTNANGVAGAFGGEYRVSDGRFTARGGAFPAWVCKGSSAGSTGKGAGMDGRDRWHALSDFQFTSTDVANHSWFVLQNTLNGAEILIDHARDTLQRRGQGLVSCENGFTGGSTTTRPSATDEFMFAGIPFVTNTGYWFITENWQSTVIQIIFIASTDGMQDFMIARRLGTYEGRFLGTGIAGDPETGSLIPWNGNNTYVIFPDGRSRSLFGNFMSYGEYNDSPRVVITVDKDGVGPGPTAVVCFMTAEMFVSQAVGRWHPYSPETFGKLFPVHRIGLASAVVGYRGRHAYIPDLLYSGESEDQGVAQNNTLPGDGTNLWIKVGHFFLPWDGSDLRRF